MSSGDFNLLHLRNLKMYNPDGSHPAVSSIFTIGNSGVPVYTSSIALGAVTASTITASTVNVSAELGVSSLVGSTLYANSGTISTLSASTFTSGSVGFSTLVGSTLYANSGTISTLNASTLTSGSFSVSTLSASTISSNLLTTQDIQLQSTQIALGLSTTSTQVNFSQGDYSSGSWLTAKSGLTNPRKLATSSTGQYQLVVSGNTSDLWLSSDSGVTWSQLTSASTGLPTLSGSAYWSSGTISANGQYILLSIYGGSLWMSQDYGRTFALTNQPTPDIWLQLNGSLTDTMGASTITPYGSPGYVTVQQPGFADQAINLANTASGTATRYLRGTWAGTSSFTLSGWINPQSLTSNYQIIYSSHYNIIEVFIDTSNRLVAQLPTGVGSNYVTTWTSFSLSVNTWYYFSVIFQINGTCSFYVNNSLIGTSSNSGGYGTVASSNVFSLGTYDTLTSNAFNGYIADLKIHNSAIPYVPIPLLQPNIWLPFENSTMDCGAQSSNAQGSTIYCPFDGAVTDSNGVSTVTAPGTAPSYVAANRAGYSGQAINLANTAGGTATNYVQGTWAGASNFTVSFWFNAQTIGVDYQYIFSAYQNLFAIVLNSSNQLSAICPSGGGLNYATIGTYNGITSNTWYYVTAIFQTGSTCSFYVNNTLIGSITNSSGVGTATTSVFELSGFDNNQVAAFNGYIDDLRISNYAISYNPVSIQTVTGSLSYVPGVVGLNAVNLVNTAGGAPTNYITGYSSPGNNFSISVWFNFQSLSASVSTFSNIFAMGDASNPNIITVYHQPGEGLACKFINSGITYITVGVTNSFTTNTWYHLHFIFQTSGTCYVYLNGSQFGSVAGQSLNGVIDRFSVGSASNGTMHAFNGYIDDFRIYNAAIPYSALVPQNYKSVALSGNAQYALASAASGWVVGSSDSEKTWSKQAVCVGTQSDLIQPNKTGLAQSSWEKDGVNYVASASSFLAAGYTAYGAFNNYYGSSGVYSWASANYTYSPSYIGSVSTTIQGIGAVAGEWLQIQMSIPQVLQSYTYACGGYPNIPKTYYIAGSNDGSTWYPVQYVSMTTNPLTANFQVCTSNLLVNYTGAQIIQGAQTGSGVTTAYSTSTTPYTYYRFIGTSVFDSVIMEFAELYLNFAKPSPSQLALNYSGQYQLVATGPAAGSIMPNQTGLASNTWTQGGVTWGASASSEYDTTLVSYKAFNNNYSNAANSWSSGTLTYNTSTGVYSGSVTTMVLGGIGSISGEWLQIKSSVPNVLQSYSWACDAYQQIPKIYYIVGSNDGSNWYPVQYVSFTVNPLTSNNTSCTTYITTNTTGSFTMSGGTTGSGTSTAYSYTTQSWMYYRMIINNIWGSNFGSVGISELYLNFQNSYSYSTNYGSTWLNSSNTISNEIVSLSPSGQYALSTNCVPPLARLTMDGTNVDAQGVLVPTTGAGTVSYSSSVVKVGTHSAYFANSAGGSATNHLNYTLPTVLNSPPTITMACWVYPTAYPAADFSTPISLTAPSNVHGTCLEITPSGFLRALFITQGTPGGIIVTSSSTIPLNTWSHIALTYNTGIGTAFLNGVSVGTNTTAGNLVMYDSNPTTTLVVGAINTSSFAFAGYIDDVRLYTQALSAHEVAALYANPALTQSVGVSSSYLPITSYSKPTLPGATANVVDAKVSQTGQYMVAVTAGADSPLARLTLDNTNVDAQGALTPATGAGSVTYSSSIKQVGTHSAFFNQTAGSTNPSVYLNYITPSVLYTPSTLTMSFWMYMTAIPASGISIPIAFSNGTSVGGVSFFIPTIGDTRVRFAYTGTVSGYAEIYEGGSGVTVNTWYHIVGIANAGVTQLYVNGSLVSSGTYSGSLCLQGGGNMTHFLLGAQYPSGTYAGAFNGYVDDVRLYTSALSAAQVASLYSTNAAINNVYYSVDSGATFNALSIGSAPMSNCSISHDGSYLTVANTAGTVYTLNRNANTYTLALGNQAGQVNQASNAIAIGNLAGQMNQSANSIVLNASGSALNATAPGFYVAPIADTAGLPMNLLGYGADSQIVKSGVTVLPGGGFSGGIGIGTNPQGRSMIDIYSVSGLPGIYATNPSTYQTIGLRISNTNVYNSGIELSMSGSSGWAAPGSFGIYMGNNVLSGRFPFIIAGDTGNIGIGTAVPVSTLHVNGWGQFGDVYDGSRYGDLQVTRAAGASDNKFHISIIRNGNKVGGLGFYPGSNTVCLLNNNDTTGLNGIFIKEGGNVGIGTTNPQATLDVWGSIYSRSAYQQVGGFMKSYVYVGVVSGVQFGTYNGTTETPFLYLTDSYNVGIGTTNPASLFHIYGGGVSTNTVLTISNSTNANTGYGAKLLFSNKRANNNNAADMGCIECLRSDTATDYSSYLAFRTADGTPLLNEWMRITNVGNVGIGTTNPAMLFAVHRKNLSATTGTDVSSDAYFAGTYGTNGSSIIGHAGGYVQGGTTYNQTTYIAFGTYSTGTAVKNELMRILDSGNVGIGKTNPSYQLELSTDSAAKPSTNTWTISSDARLKTNIQLADTARCYDIIKSLPLKRYSWRDEVYTIEQVKDRSKLGWIAQDVEAVFPKAVGTHRFIYNQKYEEVVKEDGTTEKKLVSEDVIEDCKDLNADQLYAVMYGAVQKLIQKGEEKDAVIASLQQQLADKSAQLDALLLWAQTQGFAPVAPSEPAPSEPVAPSS